MSLTGKLRRFFMRFVEIFAFAGALLVTALLSAGISFTFASRSNDIVVPNLIGTNVEEARSILITSELNLAIQGNRFDEDIPSDFVAVQEPSSGVPLKKGRTIKVWISLGPQRHTVPRIEGETLPSAQMILGQAGLNLGRIVDIYSDLYAPDTVIAQSPQAYDEAGEDTEVSVLLSRGYIDEAFVMPDFIGREYTELLRELNRSPLKISQVRNVDYPGVPKNIVVRQLPSAGTKVYKRNRITVFLSKGH